MTEKDGWPSFLAWAGSFRSQRTKGQDALPWRQYEESIRQAIRIILSTAQGERVMRPDFGCGNT